MTKEQADIIVRNLKPYLGQDVREINGAIYTVEGIEDHIINDLEEYDVSITLRLPGAGVNRRSEKYILFNGRFSIINVIELSLVIVNANVRLQILTPRTMQFNGVHFHTSAGFPFTPRRLQAIPFDENHKRELFEVNAELKQRCNVIGGLVTANIAINGIKYESNPVPSSDIAQIP